MSGIAVIDVETTGVGRTDRVVEVGVVQLDSAGNEMGSFTTLVNPGRDIGAAEIHGVTASDVTDAPRFADIAAHLASVLSGNLLVAHNAWFDLSILRREFVRADIDVPLVLPAVCTLHSSSALLGTPASLHTACTYLSIDLVDHHSALADARAAADLLRLIAWDMRWYGGMPGCGSFEWDEIDDVGKFWGAAANLDEWIQKSEHAWVSAPFSGTAPTCTRSQATNRRQMADHRIARWLTHLPLTGSKAAFSPEYVGLVQEVLMDSQVTAAEVQALELLAAQLELDAGSVQDMHRHVLETVASSAWMDGVVTDEERADLQRVAVLLGLPEAAAHQALTHCETAVGAQRSGLLAVGDRVTFTGTMTVEQQVLEAMAESVGLTHGSLTKKTKALVAADPNSESGKAKKARQYGIPVIAEQAFRYEVEALKRAVTEGPRPA